MPVLLSLHRLAWDEIDKASARYDSHARGGGGRFVTASERTIALIAMHPKIGRVIHCTRGGVEIRQFRVRRFPYAFVYVSIEPATVKVYALAHAKRRPMYWANRLRRP